MDSRGSQASLDLPVLPPYNKDEGNANANELVDIDLHSSPHQSTSTMSQHEFATQSLGSDFIPTPIPSNEDSSSHSSLSSTLNLNDVGGEGVGERAGDGAGDGVGELAGEDEREDEGEREREGTSASRAGPLYSG